MIPPKLKPGDHIRIVSPSRSMAILSEETRAIAQDRLHALGFRVTFSNHAEERDEFDSSSIAARIEDLHDAFADRSVNAILATIGGFNSNQLLTHLNYRLIKNHPKIFCGFSDITVLANAIMTATGLVTYLGPAFASFGMKKGLEYTLEYFKHCLMTKEAYEILPSKTWSDDPWYKNQHRRVFIKNPGPIIIQKGTAKGRVVGGNLCSLNLLHGTSFMPSLKHALLFIEDDEMPKELTMVEFERNLQSVLHQPDAKHLRGVVIGRFQKASKMTPAKIEKMIKTKKELRRVPVIANADFGHTTPMITLPMGGTATLVAQRGHITLNITRH
jgi:muramoyltetrapeptide carboxypeptidase LdcA involved in peptidoglycan recycling